MESLGRIELMSARRVRPRAAMPQSRYGVGLLTAHLLLEGVAMTSSETDRFFTIHKVWWWLVYTLMISGALALWVFGRVQFFGEAAAVGSAAGYEAHE